eukprot:Tamp_15508.p1 GENE.Tamp_15508~~Tamp_15508.p1  ORF type:complete len:407 (-),score=90.77 Tamp_15508:315-1397(-)
MTRLLQWGVDNTDQGTLAERAKAVREGRAEPMKLDKEVMDAMFGGKVKFLQVVVQRVRDALKSSDEDELVEALHELEDEVSDIDNANDLDHHTIDGLEPVLQLLSHASPRVRSAALWVIGSVAQSNPQGQTHLMEKKKDGYDVLRLILAPIREACSYLETSKSAVGGAETDPKLISKALYALGTLVRGCDICLEEFVASQGAEDVTRFAAAIAPIPDDTPGWLAVKRKTVALVSDLVQEDSHSPVARKALASVKLAFSTASAPSATASALAMLGSTDRELEEKVLVALGALVTDAGTASAAEHILLGPAAAAKIDGVLKVARAHLAKPAEEGQGSWEEVALLAEQLLLLVHNATGASRSV